MRLETIAANETETDMKVSAAVKTRAQLELGTRYYNRQDYAAAIPHYQKAADSGHSLSLEPDTITVRITQPPSRIIRRPPTADQSGRSSIWLNAAFSDRESPVTKPKP